MTAPTHQAIVTYRPLPLPLPSSPCPVGLRPLPIDCSLLVGQLKSAPAVTVVVPVYNAAAAVVRCISALERNTRRTRILVIDDASTCTDTIALLDDLAARGAIELVRHRENAGYTCTINEGVRHAGEDDVVLLNSDTEVGPLWLQRLRWVAYTTEDCGTVSAVSDNAGAMSVPTVGQANDWPGHLAWDECARAMARADLPWSVSAPTGHGFCMFITRRAIRRVGAFDESAFPRGYGEENDFCQRVEAQGLRNLLAPHVLVRHARSQSFGAERDALIAQGRAAVDARHPGYTTAVRSWLRSDTMRDSIDRCGRVFADLDRQREILPRQLYVLHRGGGGTPATNADLLAALEAHQDAFLLDSSQGRDLALYQRRDGAMHKLKEWTPTQELRITDTWREDYAEFLTDIIIGLGIELVHIRHLLMHPLQTLPRLCRLLGIPVVLSTHDFYLVCPSVHLLDERKRYCGGRCTPGGGVCQQPSVFVTKTPPLKHNWIHTWQERVRNVLSDVDALIATTSDAASVLVDIYPEHTDSLQIIEHGRTLGPEWQPLQRPGGRLPGPLRIVAAAHWDPHKGPDYLRGLAQRLGPRVEWHVFGRRSEMLADVAVSHGPFQRDAFRKLIEEVDPDLIGVLSIWPETYSHTLTEAWASGVPVVATDIGAVAERIRAQGGGILLPLDDLEAAAEAVRQISRDRERLVELREAVPRRMIRSTVSMAEDYRALYTSLTRASDPRPLIGYLLADRGLPAPPSAHVRLLQRIRHPRTAEQLRFRQVNCNDLLTGKDTSRYDALLIQRDAIDHHLVTDLLGHLKARLIPHAFELDDDLISESAVSRLTRDGYDWRRIQELRRIIRTAALVTVTNEYLARTASGLSQHVRVFRNAIDERYWRDQRPPKPGPSDDAARVLYMGSRTHDQDLLLLQPVFTAPELSARVGRPVVLEVVGVARHQAEREWYRRLDLPNALKAYPQFVAWLMEHRFRWNAAVAPLEDTEFNRAKSDLKLLEYGRLGIPTIASAIDPYTGTSTRLATTIPNSADAWIEALVSALGPEGSVGPQVQLASAYVTEHRLLSQQIDHWVSALMDLVCQSSHAST